MIRSMFRASLLAFISFALICEYAAAIDIYTFKKERVDQELKGNRGYITGGRPAKDERTSRKRTLIGVDVELPFASSEETGPVEEYSPATPEKPEFQPVAQTVVSSTDGKSARIIDVSSQGEERYMDIETSDEIEDEWIK